MEYGRSGTERGRNSEFCCIVRRVSSCGRVRGEDTHKLEEVRKAKMLTWTFEVLILIIYLC